VSLFKPSNFLNSLYRAYFKYAVYSSSLKIINEKIIRQAVSLIALIVNGMFSFDVINLLSP